jgi:short-subunit dehydrogenase
MDLKGKIAVVTGAGGGIGRAIATSLARRGASLALADIDPVGLAQTRDLLADSKVAISLFQLDVADREAVAALPQQVVQALGVPDILVNNAGVALAGTFEQASEKDFDWLFEINFHSLVRMTRAFLPLLRTRPEAQIVNISSLFGLIASPRQAAYCASKFAVRGFSEALRLDLEGTQIGVTVVHPGGVATSIARSARLPENAPAPQLAREIANFDKLLKLPAEKAGEIIVAAIEKRSPRVIVGSDAKLMDFLQRLAPISYGKIAKRLM